MLFQNRFDWSTTGKIYKVYVIVDADSFQEAMVIASSKAASVLDTVWKYGGLVRPACDDGHQGSHEHTA